MLDYAKSFKRKSLVMELSSTFSHSFVQNAKKKKKKLKKYNKEKI